MKTCSNIEPNTVFVMLGAAYVVDFERLVVLDIMKECASNIKIKTHIYYIKEEAHLY